MADNILPLAGIRTLEMTQNVMGPTTGLVLADMGAEVIKIEKPPDGEDTRRLRGFGAGFFPYFNRNKKSIALNLKDDQGKQLLRRLLKTADVLIENFAPGTMERLGFGYESVKKRNPTLIFCSLKGFMSGPYENRQALDEVTQMMGGLAYMTGPSGRPLRAGASITDILGGAFGVIGILTALMERQKTGQGRLVKATLFESVAFMVAKNIAAAAITGEEPPPMPERGRAWAVYDLFHSADGEQVFIGITSDRHWERFCQVFGCEDLWADSKLATNQGRIEQRDQLMLKLTRRLGAMSKSQILDLAEQARIPFAPVIRPCELSNDKQMIESGWLLDTPLQGGVKARLPKLPLYMEGCDFGLRNGPPEVGFGAGAILSQLGLTETEIAKLKREGVLGQTL